MDGKLRLGGIFEVECVGADGRLKWKDRAKNNVVTAGLNHALETELRNGTQVATWYLILVGGTGTLNAADTLSSHAGWTESTCYAGNRPAWTPGAADAGVMTNGTTVDISVNATATVKGCGLASANSGTTGTLFCTALFTQGDRAVVSGDTLKVTYTITASAV